MGRPLKIAKAQAVLTITDTSDVTQAVTVSQILSNLGIIPGMPFVTATNVGGLTSGITYWILQITGDSTFTVSSTPLNANPESTPVVLTTTSAQTVFASVGVINTGFNNPAGASNTYGVVGGNTAIFGNQVLCTAAIGRDGVGRIFSNLVANTSTGIFGVGTDFANLATGSALQVPSANINGTTDFINIGFGTATKGDVNVVVANTNATGNIIGTSGNAQTLTLNMPVTFNSNFSGLTTGTTYFVANIANTAAFTVAGTRGGAPISISTTANVTANATQNRVLLAANCPIVLNDSPFIFASTEAAFIVRQKGKQTYLVQGGTSGLVAKCQTANVANAALTPNTFSIIATYANAANVFVQSLSSMNSEIFGNTNPLLQNAAPVQATFNSATAANVSAGIPHPVVSVNKA
jgi:hypothetical protein